MNHINLKDLLYIDFEVKAIKASLAIFPINVENDYLNDGRERCLIHFLTDGTRIYKTDTDKVTINSGTLIFLPHKTKYYTRPVDVGKQFCNGLSVIFDLVDSNGIPLAIDNNMLHTRHDTDSTFKKLLEKMLKCSLDEPDNILEIKSLLLRFLSKLVKNDRANPPAMLVPALEMIKKRFRENLPVKEYADQCHMSESYFRKVFKEYTGRSPIQYRNELRFAEARRLYAQGSAIHDIAEELGFFDAGYFSKLYKQCNGHTLKSESDKDII